jgi:hypothetical protein
MVYVEDMLVLSSFELWMTFLRVLIQPTFDITDEGVCT